MAVSFEWKDKQKTLSRLTKNHDIGQKLATTCFNYMDQYVPMDTGMLSQNTLIEPFKVTYNQPYAKKMFYGSGFNFNKEHHANATSRWDKAMESAYKNEIAKEMTDFLRRM